MVTFVPGGREAAPPALFCALKPLKFVVISSCECLFPKAEHHLDFRMARHKILHHPIDLGLVLRVKIARCTSHGCILVREGRLGGVG